ncbi:MAG: outer membrane lipoprotein-sorting protein [Bacteroidota bacterium]
MKKLLILAAALAAGLLNAQTPTGAEIMKKIDQNMASKNRVFTSRMIIHGPRSTRSLESKTWSEGENRSFTEYLSPARDAGTKMLRLDDQLWIYSPSSDRTIQLSGQMLKQSMMGSDLSYEDMMNDEEFNKKYDAVVVGSEKIGEYDCWVIEMHALSEDVDYELRKEWVEKKHYIPMKEELYAKSGKLLKRTELSDIKQIGSRWFPTRIVFKDMLKQGDGTEFIIDDIQFDVVIPEHVFTKASLR